MKKLGTFLVLGLLALLVLGCAPAAAPPAAKPEVKPVVLTAVTAWVKDYVYNEGLYELARRVEQKSGGRLKIEWKGGPEVAPPFEATKFLQRGAFDILNTSGAYYTDIMPESVFLDYFDGPIKELRKAGVLDLYDKINQEKAGAKFLGIDAGGHGYVIFTKKPITKLDDFKGLKIRATPTYVPLVEALGASAVIMPPGDIYTAMERGTVDGYTWPSIGMLGMKLYEVTCCMIMPQYWTLRTVLLMNLDSWKKLSPEHQKLLSDTVREIEDTWVDPYFKKRLDDETKELVTKHGLKVIQLPEAEAKRYREFAYTENWKKWLPTAPQYGAQIKKLAEPFSKPWPPIY